LEKKQYGCRGERGRKRRECGDNEDSTASLDIRFSFRGLRNYMMLTVPFIGTTLKIPEIEINLTFVDLNSNHVRKCAWRFLVHFL
jgi:hypothetical protein